MEVGGLYIAAMKRTEHEVPMEIIVCLFSP